MAPKKKNTGSSPPATRREKTRRAARSRRGASPGGRYADEFPWPRASRRNKTKKKTKGRTWDVMTVSPPDLRHSPHPPTPPPKRVDQRRLRSLHLVPPRSKVVGKPRRRRRRAGRRLASGHFRDPRCGRAEGHDGWTRQTGRRTVRLCRDAEADPPPPPPTGGGGGGGGHRQRLCSQSEKVCARTGLDGLDEHRRPGPLPNPTPRVAVEKKSRRFMSTAPAVRGGGGGAGPSVSARARGGRPTAPPP